MLIHHYAFYGSDEISRQDHDRKLLKLLQMHRSLCDLNLKLHHHNQK